jgi:hypothetical protein
MRQLVHRPGLRQARRGQPEAGRWPSLHPHPERLILKPGSPGATAHIYADPYDDELDHVASALDALGDLLAHVR